MVEQQATIERLSLQLVASDAHSYVPLPPPSLPPAVVAAEVALVAALQSEQSGGNTATMRNAQALLQQYAELHSLDMQVRCIASCSCLCVTCNCCPLFPTTKCSLAPASSPSAASSSSELALPSAVAITAAPLSATGCRASLTDGVARPETQRKSLLERADELQSHLGDQIGTLDLELSTLGDLTAGGVDAAAMIKLKDEKHKVEESLATLTEKTAAWKATEAARNDPTTAAAAAQWRLTAAAARTTIDAKPATPPRDATDEQLTALVAHLDASDPPTQLSAFRELYDLSAPTSDENMRQRVRTPILAWSYTHRPRARQMCWGGNTHPTSSLHIQRRIGAYRHPQAGLGCACSCTRGEWRRLQRRRCAHRSCRRSYTATRQGCSLISPAPPTCASPSTRPAPLLRTRCCHC